MLKIAICDDSRVEVERLAGIILKYCAERHLNYLIDKYTSGIEVLSSCSRYTAIFLDIQMPAIGGIDLAQRIRDRDKHAKIIFVTNYGNYRSDAFTVRAFGYVVKPYSADDIYAQLDDVIEYSKQTTDEVTLTFNTDSGLKTISLADIYYFEASAHKTRVFEQESCFRISDSINDIYQKLKIQGFAMPHKSFIVNLKYISIIKGYDIYLTNNSVIPISQKRAVQFKSEFHSYLKNNFNLFISGR